MPGQKQRFVDDPVRGQTKERRIKARAQSLGQGGLAVGMAQRNMQHVMGGKTDLFRQTEGLKSRTI